MSIEEKNRLRKYYKQLRRSTPTDNIDFLENWKGSECNDYHSFFVYRSFSTEADTGKIIEFLLSQGKQVFLPRVEGEEMVAVPYGEKFVKNSYGIQEPCGEAYDGEIELTLCPLLAVDKSGNRLGYGGGYYDKYLKRHQTIKVGFCFDFQVTDNLPHEETDCRMDMIFTEKRIRKTDGES